MASLPNPPNDQSDQNSNQDSSYQPPSETAPPPPLDNHSGSLPEPPADSKPDSASGQASPQSPPSPPPSSAQKPPSQQPTQQTPQEPQKPPSQKPPSSDQPQPAKPPVKSSPFKWLAPILIGLAVLAAAGFAVYKFVLPSLFNNTDSQPSTETAPATTLTYYGLWETPQIMQPVFDQYQDQNNIKIDYQAQSSADYRQRLQTALSSDNPPDIVRLHSTWLPMFADQLQPAPRSLISPSDINSSFYSIVSDQVVVDNQVYGIPLNFDSLVLFVNHDLLGDRNVPTNWLDLQKTARQLTQIDPNTNQISQAGLALGTTSNVDHWPDIVSLMLLQNGVDLKNPDSQSTLEALKFYLLFTNSDQPTWSPAQPSSTQAFVSNQLVFYLAPTWRIPQIQKASPNFDWQTHPVPQLPQAPVVTWSNFWIEAVPQASDNPQQAWQLLKYLASTNAQQTLFQSANQARGYAQPPANKNLQSQISSNPQVAPVIQQASSAQTFYTAGSTHDGSNGINSRLINYLKDALNALSQNPNDQDAITTLQSGFQQVLSQYQLTGN